MKKRFLSVLLTALMVVTLTACGGNGKESADSMQESDKMDNESVESMTTLLEDLNEGDEVEENTTEVVEDEQVDTSVSTDEEIQQDEELGLPGGSVNPSHRTEYTVSYSVYQDYLEGLCTLEELCATSDSYGLTSNQTIEYTDGGYVVNARYDIPANGTSMDFVMTFNNRGELIHQTETTYDSQNPDGAVTFDGDFAQLHFDEGTVQGSSYTSEMEVSPEGKIISMNSPQYKLAVNHNCVVASGYSVVHEDDRTIFYWPATCEVYNAETRENLTVLKCGVFEAILYNEDGKIESIYCYNNSWSNGTAPDGKTYATIQEYLDADMSNGWGRYIAEWTYDSNGNVLTITDYNTCTFYLYE